MPDPASSGRRRRVGLAQFQRDMERSTAHLRREMEKATAPLRQMEEFNRKIGRMVEEAATAPSRLIAELIGDSAVFSPPRRQKALPAAAEAPRPDPARPPRSTGRPKAKKPRGKTANERLRDLWNTEEGQFWLVVQAKNREEVAHRIGKSLQQTRDSEMWKRVIGPARHRYRELGRLQAAERYRTMQSCETDRFGAA